MEECGPCPVFASFTLACALQLREKHRKTSVRLRETSVRVQYTYYQNTHTLPKHPHYQNTHTLPKHPHITKTPTHTCFSTICEKHQLKKPAGFSLNLYSHTACQSHTVTGPSAPSVSNALCQPCVLLRTAGNIKVRGLGVLQWHCVQPSLC